MPDTDHIEPIDAVITELLHEGLIIPEDLSLVKLMTPARLIRMREVLDRRTRHLSVFLDRVDDHYNQSAVLRSCDAMGIQNVSFIEGGRKFSPTKGVTRGTEKWLSLKTYKDPVTAASDLKNQGYGIYVSHLRDDDVSIDDLDLSKPSVLVFGNEHDGVSPELVDMADKVFRIPMDGFVESMNISVAVAVGLAIATRNAKKQAEEGYYISHEQKVSIFRKWIRVNNRLVRKAHQIKKNPFTDLSDRPQ